MGFTAFLQGLTSKRSGSRGVT